MKTIFENLKNIASELTNVELYEKCADLAAVIVKTDSRLLSVEKRISGYGTWKSSGFVNEFHFGDELKKIILKAINGKITHDEDMEFTPEDFEERISEEICEYINEIV